MDFDVEYFELGDLPLQLGEQLPSARLAYSTRGTLNRARDNVVLFPTYYTGTSRENLALVAPGRALDPERYFVVIPNLFGNGVSSSPSNQRGAAPFPRVTLFDNVQAHWRLLVERFGVERLKLCCGWSVGAQQAYHHAVLFPERVENLLAVCGSARTSAQNWVFLEAIKAALSADADYADGRYARAPLRGLSAFGRVYAGWAYSDEFFREGLYQQLGHASLAALLDAWALDHCQRDARDLLCMLDTWQLADVSANPRDQGDLPAALRAIRARSIVMPCRTDLYFSAEDSRLEVAELARGELRVIDSKFGHIAGGPDRVPEDSAHIEQALWDLLGRA